MNLLQLRALRGVAARALNTDSVSKGLALQAIIIHLDNAITCEQARVHEAEKEQRRREREGLCPDCGEVATRETGEPCDACLAGRLNA